MAVVLITGSNSGFGLATATRLLAQGHDVAAGMRNPDRGGDLMRGAAGLDGRLEIVQLEVTDPTSRADAVDRVLDRFGTVDVLVNNAGISRIGAFEDTPPSTVEQIFATNTIGPLELTRLVLPTMRTNRSGRIINVTAIGAILCTPFLGSYVASKHALDAATAALDLEVRPFGIRAVSILPGSFRTHIVDDAGDIVDSAAYANSAGAFRSGILQRIAESSDDVTVVADAIIEAATATMPTQRTVVASEFMAGILERSVAEFANLHRIEAERLELA